MKWSLLELRKYQETPLEFSETLDLKQNLIKRDGSILDLEPVVVDGILTVDKAAYIIHYRVQTVITIPSTRSLEPVVLPMDFTVDEVFMTPEQYNRREDLIPEEEIIILDKDSIDLDESIEDNLLLAIPTRVLTEAEEHADKLPEGDGWQVMSEEDYLLQQEQAADQLDPRLAKLSELFSDDDSK